ncbi:hypothetical protein DRQ15_06660 [candidate division KSB1 bacterium]|nr:MAG: hypothetical protein DRQ12_05215 [candidate division KSB1 bacterium]RKY90765.1 MAG: hypothetical protein DRQ15_06660 [candidate division KSB1 bacterium]HDI51693.1 carboxypeptidase regulatory-like domain-containing protein [Bacteroidota bacterium]
MKKIYVLLFALVIVAGCEKAQEVVAPEKGTISGTVTNNNTPVKGVFVLLLKQNSIESEQPLANASVTNDQGKYKILMVEPSSYYVAAIKDENSNLLYNPGTDLLGWYGHEEHGVIIPDLVTVFKGQNVTGIDITKLL